MFENAKLEEYSENELVTVINYETARELLSCLGRRSECFAENVFFPARRKFRCCEAASAVKPRGHIPPGEFPRDAQVKRNFLLSLSGRGRVR